MPTAVLRALGEMIPQLQAEASLRHVAEIAAGSGSLKPDAHRALLRDWEATANSGGPRLSTRDEAMLAAAAMGFQVVTDGE